MVVPIRVRLESFVKAKKAKSGVVRDARKRVVLVAENCLDRARLSRSGLPLHRLGRRLRLMSNDLSKEIRSFIAPRELIDISRVDPSALDGIKTPLGTLVWENGIYLRYSPGIEEVGVNDRGEVLLRRCSKESDSRGPVQNSTTTCVCHPSPRVVGQVSRDDVAAGSREAHAWLKAFESLSRHRSLLARVRVAGVEFTHRTHHAGLHRCVKQAFFSSRDPQVGAMGRELANRLRRLGRTKVPGVTVISLIDLPRTEKDYDLFLRRLERVGGRNGKEARNRAPAGNRGNRSGGDPALRPDGLPVRLSDSRFFDAETGTITPVTLTEFPLLRELPERLTVITVNTDHFDEVRQRAVFGPLAAIFSLIRSISARSASVVLSGSGGITVLFGPRGSGKSTAAMFFASQGGARGRGELLRRARIDLQLRKPGAAADSIDEELGDLSSRVGVVCQDERVQLLMDRKGRWEAWPTELRSWVRAAAVPGVEHVLAAHQPLIENVTADFGGSGRAERLGRVTHGNLSARFFYDADWEEMRFRPMSRSVHLNVYLTDDLTDNSLLRRLTPDEVVRLLLRGTSHRPEAGRDPSETVFCDLLPDVSGLLASFDCAGERLATAYERAKAGDFSLLGGGDPELGKAVFERLDVQARHWLEYCADVETYLVNTRFGRIVAHDAVWLLSEHRELLEGRRSLTPDRFRALLLRRYGVTYDARGDWSHLVDEF